MERILKDFSQLEIKFINVFYVEQNTIARTSEILDITETEVRELKKELKKRIKEILAVR